MFDRILVVCDGNICRSPTMAAILKSLCPEKSVESAGLVGLEGHDMDLNARQVAFYNGLDCAEHMARKLTSETCVNHDLILVMEARQKDRITQLFPEASGKVFLASHWNGKHDIPDPYRRGLEAFERIYPMMHQAAEAWAKKL